MRRNGDEQFAELMCKCLELVQHFCDVNPTNQEIVAKEIDAVILPLLLHRDPVTKKRPFVDATSKCITALVSQNEALCVRYAGLLVKKVSVLALTDPEGGRRVELLKTLETLLIANGHTIASAQISVCKGATVNGQLIELTGALETGELANLFPMDGGVEMDRLEVSRLLTPICPLRLCPLHLSRLFPRPHLLSSCFSTISPVLSQSSSQNPHAHVDR